MTFFGPINNQYILSVHPSNTVKYHAGHSGTVHKVAGSMSRDDAYLLVLFFAQAQCELELAVLVQVWRGWFTPGWLRLRRRALQQARTG